MTADPYFFPRGSVVACLATDRYMVVKDAT